MEKEELWDILRGRESISESAKKLGLSLDGMTISVANSMCKSLAYLQLVEIGQIDSSKMYSHSDNPKHGDFGMMDGYVHVFYNGEWKSAYKI